MKRCENWRGLGSYIYLVFVCSRRLSGTTCKLRGNRGKRQWHLGGNRNKFCLRRWSHGRRWRSSGSFWSNWSFLASPNTLSSPPQPSRNCLPIPSLSHAPLPFSTISTIPMRFTATPSSVPTLVSPISQLLSASTTTECSLVPSFPTTILTPS